MKTESSFTLADSLGLLMVSLHVSGVEKHNKDGLECYKSDCILSRDNTVFWRGPFFKGMAHRSNPQPTVEELFSSLLMAGEAHFDNLSFADFCDEFGYDEDSRKAEQTYNACRSVGIALESAFSDEEIERLRESSREM